MKDIDKLAGEVERAKKVYKSFKLDQICLRNNVDVAYAQLLMAERMLKKAIEFLCTP